MSTKKPSVRDYKFSDGQIKQSADGIVVCVQRDAASFATRGVTAATVTTFSGTITSFDNVPTDEELLGPVIVATENKDIIAENLRVGVRTVRTMAENKYGANAALYRTFGFDGLSEVSDEQLYRVAKRVSRVATAQLAGLASEGLTAAFITNLTGMATSFDTAIDVQEDAINARDLKTQERIDKGNLVYKEMVRLCNIGKDLFSTTDEAKYNDYVIYNTPSAKPEAAVPVPAL